MVIVLFKTQPRVNIDGAAYQEASKRMLALASSIPGFISFRRCSSEDGDGFAMVTFESDEALETWRHHPEHVAIQRRGREEFYDYYWVHVLRSVREYEWRRNSGGVPATE